MIRTEIESAVEYWRQKLNLPQWKVTVRWDITPDNPDAGASVKRVDGRDIATICFEHNILDEDPKVINHYIVHELMHLHLDYLYTVAYNMMDRDHPEVRMLLRFMYTEIEKVVDRIATAISDSDSYFGNQ